MTEVQNKNKDYLFFAVLDQVALTFTLGIGKPVARVGGVLQCVYSGRQVGPYGTYGTQEAFRYPSSLDVAGVRGRAHGHGPAPRLIKKKETQSSFT